MVAFEDPQSPGRLVAHRVVKRLPGASPVWQTKGDANAVNDPVPVPAQAIRGQARWAVPGLGAAVSRLTGWLGVALLVGLPLAVLLITELNQLSRRPPPVVPEG